MRTFLLTVLLLGSVSLFSQTKTTNISEKKIGGLSCSYFQAVNLESGDTTFAIYLGFKDLRYPNIVSIESIYFVVQNDSTEALKFVKDLKMAYSEYGNGVQLSWDREAYRIMFYEKQSFLYLYQGRKNGDGYTMLADYQIKKVIRWFESIGFN